MVVYGPSWVHFGSWLLLLFLINLTKYNWVNSKLFVQDPNWEFQRTMINATLLISKSSPPSWSERPPLLFGYMEVFSMLTPLNCCVVLFFNVKVRIRTALPSGILENLGLNIQSSLLNLDIPTLFMFP